jgi:hypothetical protein
MRGGENWQTGGNTLTESSSNHSFGLFTVMRFVAGVGFLVLCGGGCGSSSSALPDAALADAALPDAAAVWPTVLTPGRSVARIAVSPTRVVVLEEMLTGFERYAPGPRRVRAIDRGTLAETTWEPAPPARIADAVVHPSGAVSLALVDDDHRITLVRLDDNLESIAKAPLVDPSVATDPPVSSNPPTELLANSFTAEAVRVGALGEDALVAVFTVNNAVIAYRQHAEAGAFTTTWRSLIEPSVGITPFLPIGGSYDTFGAIVAWFRPALATDGKDQAYLAVWAGQKRLRVHNAIFGEDQKPLFTGPGDRDSDVLLTKIDGAGQRQWTRVVGARYEDEPYALSAGADEVVIAGRSRRNPGFDNSQWDPWLAALDGSGRTVVSRTFPFDASGILLGASVDDAGRIVAAGSDGWSQNPDGLSILSFGAKLLFTLTDAAAAPVRMPIAPGPRHNEIRSVTTTPEGTWFGGHEDGPLTHSGDGDASQIHATGVIGFLPR